MTTRDKGFVEGAGWAIHVLRQTMRGCGALPYLGDHPGTFILLMVSILGALAGGWIGAVVMLGVFGPFYLMGAYERAQYSDQLVRNDEFEDDMSDAPARGRPCACFPHGNSGNCPAPGCGGGV